MPALSMRLVVPCRLGAEPACVCFVQVSSAMYSSHMEARTRVVPSVDQGTPSAGHAVANSTAAAASQQPINMPAELPEPVSEVATSSAVEAGSPTACCHRLSSRTAPPGHDSIAVVSPSDASLDSIAKQLADLPLGRLSKDEAGAGELCLVKGDTGLSLRMFGAAPSPHLRQAQADFAEALEDLVALANQQNRLRSAFQAWQAVL
jgi:hypothetical protein